MPNLLNYQVSGPIVIDLKSMGQDLPFEYRGELMSQIFYVYGWRFFNMILIRTDNGGKNNEPKQDELYKDAEQKFFHRTSLT